MLMDLQRTAIVSFALLAATPAVGQEPVTATPNTDSAPRTLVLSLADALRIAAGESETVWVAEAGVMRGVGNERIARSGYFPQVSGSADYTRTLRSQFSGINFGGTGGTGGSDAIANDLPFGRKNQYTLGLTLNQLIFDGGQTPARNREAQARRRSAEIDVTAAQAQTQLDVTRAYFDALLSDQLVTIAQSSLGQTEEVLRQTEVAQRVGAQAEFDLLRAQVARDNQLPVLIQRQNEQVLAYSRLKQLLNVPLIDNLQLTTGVEDLDPRFATVSDPAPAERSGVRQAQENVTASKAELAAARGQRLPSIALSSRYAPVAYPNNGAPGWNDFREDWTVSVSLSVPILTWGRLRGGEMVARGNLSEAQARLQQSVEAAALDAQSSQQDLAAAQATLRSNTSTVDQARRAYSIAQLRYREGISSQIELTDARLQLEQAEVSRARALRDVQVARTRLALLRDLPLGQTAGSASTPVQTTQQSTQPPAAATPTSQTSVGGVTTAVPGISGTGGPP
jgi:outer membrane protein TolC